MGRRWPRCLRFRRVHNRRMEVYLYFDLSETAPLFHFLDEPDETRHLLIKNEVAADANPVTLEALR